MVLLKFLGGPILYERVSKLIASLVKFPRTLVDALFGYDFFISYAHADGTDYPEKLSQDLTKLGFQTHLDTRDYHVGADLGKLTEIRLKNSRNLVVVCRPMALEQSIWVRREIDAFEQRGQSVRLINVENAVEEARDDPPSDTVAAWLSEPMEPGGEKSRAEVLLRIEDISDAPDHQQRVPGFDIAERLQNAFRDRRQRTKRLRVLTGALGLFVVLSIGLGIASVFAVSAADRAQREALAARLQFSAVEAERLATTPDTILALRKILDDVAAAQDGLGYVPVSTRRALWRVLNTTRDLRIFDVETAQVYDVGWDADRELVITLERDGGVSGYSKLGAREQILAPLGEDNARLSFTHSGLFIQRAEGETWAIYSLDGALLLRLDPRSDNAVDHALHDIAPTRARLLWVSDDACLRVTALDQFPETTTPIFCVDEDEIDFAIFADGQDKIFLTTESGFARILDTNTGDVLAENNLGSLFHTWRLRADGQALVGFHPEKIVRLNGALEVVSSRSLGAKDDVEMVSGEVIWEEDRILAISNENTQMMQVFSLALEPDGPPFRLHSSTALGVAPSIGAFVSVGYIDRKVRLISARPHGSQLLLQNSALELSKVAYCSDSKRLLLGDFNGNITLFDPETSSQLQNMVLYSDEMVRDITCLENGRWVAVAGGRVFSSDTFDADDLTTIDISDEYAFRLAPFGDGVIVTTLGQAYSLGRLALDENAVLNAQDALPITIPGTEHSMIFVIAVDKNDSRLVIGVKHSEDDASLVFVDLRDGKVIGSVVQQTNEMDTPEALAISPNGEQIISAGSMMRLEAFDKDGQSTWSVRGADNPFVTSLAYADDDFFVGGGFWGNISLWSRDGTVEYSNFDPDLGAASVSLAAGGPREVFATDSDGTLKRLTFDVDELEALALRVFGQLTNPN
ncbi:TIR domain-containing protein [Shimia sp. R9_3]|nr:TIR domain-containing protein [Shimia sp. R9_3]